MIYTSDMTQTVIVSTASPFKFNSSVAKALLEMKRMKRTSFELLELFLSERTGWNILDGLKNLDKKEILHNTVCEKDEMRKL